MGGGEPHGPLDGGWGGGGGEGEKCEGQGACEDGRGAGTGGGGGGGRLAPEKGSHGGHGKGSHAPLGCGLCWSPLPVPPPGSAGARSSRVQAGGAGEGLPPSSPFEEQQTLLPVRRAPKTHVFYLRDSSSSRQGGGAARRRDDVDSTWRSRSGRDRVLATTGAAGRTARRRQERKGARASPAAGGR